MTRVPILSLLIALPCAAQSLPDDPFAGFRRATLSNGVRVWLRELPDAADVSVGLVVPYGSDQDPVGREETAHFVEHMLFSDHRSSSEERIKDEVESRGGSRNGFTAADHTFYYVTTPAEHGLFGLEWLARVVEPHAMDSSVVERNRLPVALEIGARPRELPERIGSWLTPHWIHRPGFWLREFGLPTRSGRDYDPWASLQAITPEDLRVFYDRYYAPEAMTLVVVGDEPADSVLGLAERTFGTLPRRPAPSSYGAPRDPGRPDRTVSWTVRPDVRYRRIFKVYDLDAARHVRLLFLARYLDRRLTARLRFGETKAVYGVGATVVQRGPAAYLTLDAPVAPDRFEFARGVIDDELTLLRDGSTPPDRFAQDRDAVVERTISENREAQDLVFWAYRAFYRPGLHETFPDLPARFAAMDLTELAEEVRRLTDPTREVESVIRPHLLPQAVLAAAAFALTLLTLRLARRLLVTPAPMPSIRYVARLRATLPAWAILGAAYAAVGGAVAVGIVGGATRAAYAWIVPVDVYALHLAMWGVAIAGSVLLVVGFLALPPRKLLVFGDHVRIKHVAYRSRVLTPIGIRRARLVRFPDLVRDPPPWPTLPMTLGISRPAVHLEPREGMGYLLRVRDPWELLGVLRELGIETDEAEAVPDS